MWPRPWPSLTPSLQSWRQRSGPGLPRQSLRMRTWTSMVSARRGCRRWAGGGLWSGLSHERSGTPRPSKGKLTSALQSPAQGLLFSLGALCFRRPCGHHPAYPTTLTALFGQKLLPVVHWPKRRLSTKEREGGCGCYMRVKTVSVWRDEEVLESRPSPVGIYSSLLNSSLKDGSDGTFYVICILPHFFFFKKKKEQRNRI